MKLSATILMTFCLVLGAAASLYAQSYDGTQKCKNCHRNTSTGHTEYTQWSNTLHAKTILPDTATNAVRPLADFTSGKIISMGAAYGNAQVIISKSGPDLFAQVGASGTTYPILWTFGWGFRQLYLVKIDSSYYPLPIQYNLNGYLDNSSGSWDTYGPGNWFNANGSPKSVDNVFRAASWDKNCMGCHVTAGRVHMIVSGSDTSWGSSWANNSSKDNIVVGCENCHGPNDNHSGASSPTMLPTNLPTKQAKIEVCAQCHSRACSNNGQGTAGTFGFAKDEVNDAYFNPADTIKPLSGFMNFNLGANQPGGPATWPDLVTSRLNAQQYLDFRNAKHFTTPYEEITCFTCHSAHSNSPNPHNLIDTLSSRGFDIKVSGDDNTLCLTCHAGYGPFASISLNWVQNEPTYRDSIGAVVSQHTKHELYDPLNSLSTGGIGRCTECHMAKVATSAKPYDIRTHAFTVVPPEKTIFYASGAAGGARGMLNTCAASCHRNPSGDKSLVPDFGVGSDPALTDWGEQTDIALAESLNTHWKAWGFPTSVKEIKSSVPVAYNLSQNYPNPFNPSTKIVVDLPRGGTASLEVYNIIGARVATIMAGSYSPGRYEVTWRGRDDAGIEAPSGIYFYKLVAGAYSETKKMMMVK